MKILLKLKLLFERTITIIKNRERDNREDSREDRKKIEGR